MTKDLRVLLDDREIGTITQLRTGKLQLTYDAAWLADPEAMPLSLSMPLAAAEHDDTAVAPFLWGLLPENEATLQSIGRRFSVSSRNPFALLTHIGEDLQGAVQIVPPESVAGLKQRQGIKMLSRTQLEAGFKELMRDPAATQFTSDAGQFSLAGAQRKKTLCLVNGRWGEPRGRTPSTHILKPSIVGHAGQAYNEMFCIRLAGQLGLPTPPCWVEMFGTLPVIVIQRYDRLRYSGRRLVELTAGGGEVRRVHQEDMCQALKVHPAIKYQSERGPGMQAVMQVLSGSGEPSVDRDRFMRACAFNFVIGGTDAHAKNYSILLTQGGRFRLAPLYDVASWLPYADRRRNNKLAMSVDGQYNFDQIHPRHWEAEAKKCGHDGERTVAHVRDMLSRLPDVAKDLWNTCRFEGLNTPDLASLVGLLVERVRQLKRVYAAH